MGKSSKERKQDKQKSSKKIAKQIAATSTEVSPTSLKTFKEAVDDIPQIKDSFMVGLKAFKANSKKVSVADTAAISGSVDIDATLQCLCPEDNRWDYVFGYNEKAYFVEVHPAFTNEVDTVCKKLSWLKSWLRKDAKSLDDIKSSVATFSWLYTDKFAIEKTSRQYKMLAQIGLVPKAKLVIK